MNRELKNKIERAFAYLIVYGISALIIAGWFSIVLKPMP